MKTQRLALFDPVEALAESQPAERTPPKEILIVRLGKNKYTKEEIAVLRK